MPEGDPNGASRGGSHDAIRVLGDRGVRFYVASRFCSGTALTLMRAAVAWQVFDLTGSAFHLGLIGLIQFVPVLPLSLVGGAVADSFDRRRVVMLSQAATLVGSLVLFTASRQGTADLPLIYGVVFALAVASTFENPSRVALLPTLVPRDLFPTAVTLHSTFQNLSWVTGPVVTGFTIDAGGVPAAYAAHVGLVAGSLALLALLPAPRREGERRGVTLEAIREGVGFVRSRPAVLAAMSLDMFAVIFGSATALLPVYADEILGVGPRGYGVLSSGLELGTLLMAAVLLVLPPIRRPGRALLLGVLGYGLATLVFGVSRSFPLSLAALALAGMADQVSMVTRSTIVQLSTPDALRGRVSSVNLIFVGASNQLGAVEAGFVAALTSATFSVVSGGALCLVTLAAIAARVPELRRYRLEAERPPP